MLITQQDVIRAVILNEEFEHRDEIRDVVLPMLTESDGSIVTKLSVIMLLCQEAVKKKIDCVKHLQEKFSAVLAVIEEYGVKLPEEEAILKKTIDELEEDGEGTVAVSAPIANVTAGIEPTVPRIKARKRVAEADTCQRTK